MATLEELARNKFPDPPLSAAEERVVRAAPDGTVSDCRLGGGDDPAKVDAWPASRNVRADLLNLTNAKVGLLVDQEASWPEKGRLFLDGFVYDQIAAGPADAKVPIDATTRLRWLRLQPDEYGYLPQPYEQL